MVAVFVQDLRMKSTLGATAEAESLGSQKVENITGTRLFRQNSEGVGGGDMVASGVYRHLAPYKPLIQQFSPQAVHSQTEIRNPKYLPTQVFRVPKRVISPEMPHTSKDCRVRASAV